MGSRVFLSFSFLGLSADLGLAARLPSLPPNSRMVGTAEAWEGAKDPTPKAASTCMRGPLLAPTGKEVDPGGSPHSRRPLPTSQLSRGEVCPPLLQVHCWSGVAAWIE